VARFLPKPRVPHPSSPLPESTSEMYSGLFLVRSPFGGMEVVSSGEVAGLASLAFFGCPLQPEPSSTQPPGLSSPVAVDGPSPGPAQAFSRLEYDSVVSGSEILGSVSSVDTVNGVGMALSVSLGCFQMMEISLLTFPRAILISSAELGAKSMPVWDLPLKKDTVVLEEDHLEKVIINCYQSISSWEDGTDLSQTQVYDKNKGGLEEG
jgi:hypothetical protein